MEEEDIRKKMCDDLTSLQGSIMRDEPHDIVRMLMKRFVESYESVYGKDIPQPSEPVTDEPIHKEPPKRSLKSIFADCLCKY